MTWRRAVASLCCAVVASLAACGDADQGADVNLDAEVTDTPSDVDPPDFVGHTVAGFASPSDFHAFAGPPAAGPAQAKFVFTGFGEPTGELHFLDPAFYALHDEWYFFRLLSGVAIAGWDEAPLDLGADSIAHLYDAVRALGAPPLDLRWHESRLYSPDFYASVLGGRQVQTAPGQWKWQAEPRFFGAGSLLYFAPAPERPRPEALWAFEIEYPDRATEAELLVYDERVQAGLPPELRDQLHWLARSSPYQRGLAAKLRAGDGPLKDRVLLPEDLVIPGEVIIYNEGITAGFVKLREVLETGGSSFGPSDIAVLGGVPDYLPPVAGIVTSTQQTPLAHLNLLAKSRGTPNAYIGGSAYDPRLKDWSLNGKPVVLALRDAAARWKELTSDQYKTWLAKRGQGARTIAPVDPATAPSLVDLTEGSLAESRGLIPLIGGKCAGMMAFQDVPALELPRAPLCLTIRPYAEHLEPVRATIVELLAHPEFSRKDDEGRRVRFVTLEGGETFREQHAGSPADLKWLDETFPKQFPASTWIGYLGRQGGLKGLIERQAIDPVFEAALREALLARYGDFQPEQGIRFRSSSTAEDVEGFNGAGLYDSNTGYLFPEQLASAKLRERSVAWAVKRTWASYWTFEAFEERRLAGIDHLSGHMAVLVHPTYTDLHEQANGVITFSVAQPLVGAPVREMVVNAQHGALSVTNPPPGVDALPEVSRVTPAGIDRLQSASPDPAEVASDAELAFLFQHIGALADLWLAEANAALPKAQRASSLVLDLEWKRMAGAWPMTSPAQTGPDRLVLKQVRVLDRAPPALTAAEREMVDTAAIPKDVFAATSLIQRRWCATNAGPQVTVEVQQVLTDRAAAPLVPWSTIPFPSRVRVTFGSPVPGLDVLLGPGPALYHSLLLDLDPAVDPDGAWSLRFRLPPPIAKQLRWSTLELDASGAWKVGDGQGAFEGAGLSCQTQDVYLGPSAYLEALLDGP